MPQTSHPSQPHDAETAIRPPVSQIPVWPVLVVVLLFAAVALPLILAENLLGRGAFDQLFFHERVVRQFAAQWPDFDLRRYESATTPGYHILLAAVCRFVSSSAIVLQLVSMLLTVGLLTTVTLGIRAILARDDRGQTPRPTLAMQALALALPLACSMHVVYSGIWLLPENLGWWGVAACLLISLRDRMSPGSMLLGGLVLAGLVLVRHNHLWCAAPLCAAAWITASPLPGNGGVRSLLSDAPRRFARAVPMALLCLPAAAIVGFFFWHWQGATPPSFQVQHARSINFATPAFVLSMFALLGPFFLPHWLPGLRLLRDERAWVFTPWALVAVVLAAVPTTTYLEQSRSSGLWIIVKHAPVIANHTSIVLLVLAPIGAIVVRSFLAAVPPRRAWILGIALAGFIAAQAANSNCWQRYIEPMCLLWLALMAACVEPDSRPALATPNRRPEATVDASLRWMAPMTLAFVFALHTGITLFRNVPHPETRPTPDGRREPIPREPSPPPPVLPHPSL